MRLNAEIVRGITVALRDGVREERRKRAGHGAVFSRGSTNPLDALTRTTGFGSETVYFFDFVNHRLSFGSLYASRHVAHPMRNGMIYLLAFQPGFPTYRGEQVRTFLGKLFRPPPAARVHLHTCSSSEVAQLECKILSSSNISNQNSHEATTIPLMTGCCI
jgi:hypothetical protein